MKKLIIFFFLFSIVLVYGHVPYLEKDECLEDCDFQTFFSFDHEFEKSIALYGYFENNYDIDVIQFSLEDKDFDEELIWEGNNLLVEDQSGIFGRKLFVGTMVPGCEEYSHIKPSFIVVGPAQINLPEFNNEYDLPDDILNQIKPGYGILYIENKEQGHLWYEEYTMKNYFDQINIDLVLTEPGDYKIIIWEPGGAIGDYVVEVGYIEVWKFDEIMRALKYYFPIVHDLEIHNYKCRCQL